MKLLIITQKVDKNDAVLGFFHLWLKTLALKFEQLTVICLYRGEFDLPANVRVFSLGKETGVSKIKYLKNFYLQIFSLRHDYNAVFVHMNDEYVILAGWLWRLWGKKIYLWRNHIKGNFKARLAVLLAHRVFSTSPYAFVARYKKNLLMPAGIDTELFRRDPTQVKEKNSLFYFGRLSPVKRVNVFLAALEQLKKSRTDFKAYIIGDPPPRDLAYAAALKDEARQRGLSDSVFFLSGVPNTAAPAVNNQYEISVNLTNSGSLDKTILEAMACENLVLVSNQSFAGKISKDYIFSENDSKLLAEKTKSLLALGAAEKAAAGRELRQFVLENHSLEKLANELSYIIS